MKSLFTLLLVTICISASAQNLLLNGSFENNSATNNVTNLTTTWPLYVSDSWEVDAGRMNLDSISVCGVASDGSWYVTNCAGCGGIVSTYIGFSLKLSTPLIMGAQYTLSFDKKYCGDASQIQIGISNDSTFVGTNIQAFAAPVSNNWTHDAYVFLAPAAGQYLTVGAVQNNALDTGYIALDNFKVEAGVVAGSCGTNLQVTNDSCFGSCNGAIVFTPASGTPPYSLRINGTLIASFNSTYTYSNLCPGSYYYKIDDALFSCGDSNFVNVTEPSQLLINGSTIPTSCFTTDGQLSVVASGGTPPYQYSIDMGITWQTSPNFIGLSVGGYTAEAMDNNGCMASITLIVQFGGPQFGLMYNNIHCLGDTGSICGIIFGGLPPYTYLWNTTDTTLCIWGLTAGTYTLQVTDSNGCTTTNSVTLTNPSPITTSIQAIAPSCGQCDGIAGATISGGTFPYTYLWTPGGITTSVLTNFCSGFYTLFVADVYGCLDSTGLDFSASQCDSVWPGDANDNGVADNIDVLALGINYGATGPVRTGASDVWVGQACINWNDSLSSGVNLKHSDCDGNGIINADDTVPISLNYGMIHPRLLLPVNNATIPDLYLQCTVDTIGPHQVLHVKMHLGSTSLPVAAVYGVAFTIQLDPALIDTNTVSFDYSNSVLGTIGVDLMSFHHSFYSTGNIDVAVTKTNHINALNVDSIIGVLDVVITDNVSTVQTLRLLLSSVTAITHDESFVALNSRGDSVVVDPTFTGIEHPNAENSISIFPSPAHNLLMVNSDVEIKTAQLFNSLGENVMARSVHQKKFSLDMTGIGNGIYFLELTTSAGSIKKKSVCAALS